MANLQKVQIAWSGFQGGPGVSTFYCLNASSALPELKGLFADFSAFMPADVTISYPVTGDIIDPLNGDLVGSWTASSRAVDVGSNTGGYAAPVGVMVRWETGTILDGHRLRGRTFFVPMAGSLFDTDGTVDGSSLGSLQYTVNGKVATLAGNLVVWHRPTTSHAGGYSAVSAGVVPDEAVILRSRRD